MTRGRGTVGGQRESKYCFSRNLCGSFLLSKNGPAPSSVLIGGPPFPPTHLRLQNPLPGFELSNSPIDIHLRGFIFFQFPYQISLSSRKKQSWGHFQSQGPYRACKPSAFRNYQCKPWTPSDTHSLMCNHINDSDVEHMSII